MSALSNHLVERLVEHPGADRADVVEWIRSTDPLLDLGAVDALADRVLSRRDGLGPIDPLLTDPGVTEIMVNGPGPIWIDRGHGSEPTTIEIAAEEIAVLIERILDPLALRVDRSSPMVDARLPDGSRVNVIVPPLALDGPVVTIRRFRTSAVTLDHFGDGEVAQLLVDLIDERTTILVVGPTAAGKTTLLNALGNRIDGGERVVTIEDTAELSFTGPHVVRLESRPANSEGVGEVTLRHLVRNALRMRPDRLVIGEVRGAEALDLVLALNTGHRGSLATCHASDPAGALRRLETLALLGDAALPIEALRDQIVGAIDVVVQVGRVGSQRRIVSICGLTPSGHLTTLWRLDGPPPPTAVAARAA